MTTAYNSGGTIAVCQYHDGLLSTEFACRWLGVSKSWLDKARVSGTGPRFCRVGRLIRYRITDLEAYLDHACHQSTSDSTVPGHQGGRR